MKVDATLRVDRSEGTGVNIHTLCEALLKRSTVFSRVAPAARRRMVETAFAEGRACAEEIRAIWGQNPWTIARQLGISVVHSEADASFGSTVVLAEYAPNPPIITLYHPAIRQVNRRQTLWTRLHATKLSDCTPIFLAHELYHHLARCAAPPPFSRTCRVPLLRIGLWCWSSPVNGLEEVAAGAFAQALVGLQCYPGLIESMDIWQDGEEQ